MSKQKVQAVLDRYDYLTVVPEAQLQERRKQFLPYIIRECNNPNYGFLIKSNEKIQDDIICLKDRTHLDCMTAVAVGNPSDKIWKITATWVVYGKIQDRWKWGNVDDYEHRIQPPLPINANPVPVPVPVPVPPAGIEAKLDEILRILNEHFRG